MHVQWLLHYYNSNVIIHLPVVVVHTILHCVIVAITLLICCRFDPASGTTPIWLDDLRCSYSDTSLAECNSRGVGIHDCSHSEDVAISCLGSA